MIDKKRQIKEFIGMMASEMVSYARMRYKIPDFKPKIKISYSSRTIISYGGHVDGEPVVYISTSPVLWMIGRKNSTRRLLEYDEFKSDPEIGEIRKASWKLWLAAVLAHEIAHAVQYYAICHPKKCKKMLQPYLHTDAEEHGPFWRDIYRGFRVRYVNNFEF